MGTASGKSSCIPEGARVVAQKNVALKGKIAVTAGTRGTVQKPTKNCNPDSVVVKWDKQVGGNGPLVVKLTAIQQIHSPFFSNLRVQSLGRIRAADTNQLAVFAGDLGTVVRCKGSDLVVVRWDKRRDGGKATLNMRAACIELVTPFKVGVRVRALCTLHKVVAAGVTGTVVAPSTDPTIPGGAVVKWDTRLDGCTKPLTVRAQTIEVSADDTPDEPTCTGDPMPLQASVGMRVRAKEVIKVRGALAVDVGDMGVVLECFDSLGQVKNTSGAEGAEAAEETPEQAQQESVEVEEAEEEEAQQKSMEVTDLQSQPKQERGPGESPEQVDVMERFRLVVQWDERRDGSKNKIRVTAWDVEEETTNSMLLAYSEGDFSDTTELQEVARGTNEFSSVEERMQRTVRGVRVHSVCRVMNKHQWKRCRVQYDLLLDKRVTQCFHGTRQVPPSVIYESREGFDPTHSRKGLWGQAAYFAHSSRYSNPYAFKAPEGKQVFLASVLVGKSVLLSRDEKLRQPPSVTESSIERFDSVTGEVDDSVVHMVYQTGMAYPDYLITYSEK